MYKICLFNFNINKNSYYYLNKRTNFLKNHKKNNI